MNKAATDVNKMGCGEGCLVLLVVTGSFAGVALLVAPNTTGKLIGAAMLFSFIGLALLRRMLARRSDLFQMIDGRHFDQLAAALERGVPVEQRWHPLVHIGEARADGPFTPLHRAIQRAAWPALEILFAHGANPNARTRAGVTPLHLALRRSDPDLVRLLLQQGADPQLPDPQSGLTAQAWARSSLHIAVHLQDSQAISELLASGADLEAPDPALGLTPLQWCAGEGCVDILRQLLAAGARPDSRIAAEHAYFPGAGALQLAVNQRKLACAAELMAAGADPRAINERQESPLLFALAQPDSELLAVLLPPGADVSTPLAEEQSISLLSLAARSGHVGHAALLLQRGADILACAGSERLTALHHAVLRAKLEMVTFLLDHGADLEARAIDGKTPLHLSSNVDQALRNQRLYRGPSPPGPLMVEELSRWSGLVRLLLARGADSKARTDLGETALHLAASDANDGAVAELLRAGLDVHATDHEGHTPLHLAAGSGAAGVIGLLLEAGADPNARASYGRQPLDLLPYNEERIRPEVYADALRLLRKAGAVISAA